MSKEPTISERIKRVRARFGWTQEDMAKALKMSRSYISQLEAGVKDAGPKFVTKLLACEHSPEPITWLLDDEEGASPIRPRLIEKAETYPKIAVRDVPLLSWAQAGMAIDFEELPFDWQETIPAAIPNKDAFAVQLRGDSMEPKFSDGDVAIVLRDVPARNGDLVVANIKEQGCTFKIMHLVGGDPRHLKLTAYNPAYPAMDFTRENFHWIYPVHSVNKIVRR